VYENAVFRLENEVGVGASDVDAYARHGSPDGPSRRRAQPGAQRLMLIARKDCQH
jgi:hypothetical protein